jgi:proline racemase
LYLGGVFYALTDVDQIGLKIAPENARKLAMIGRTCGGASPPWNLRCTRRRQP